MPTVALHTLGCKLNFSETSTLARSLQVHGFQKVEFHDIADYYIINTCSVTENADRECKEIVRRVLRTNPEGKIVITGCFAQLKPREISEIPGVDLVLGASEKFNISAHLSALKVKQQALYHSCDIDAIEDFQSSYSFGDRTRSFLKIQDGCDYTCTYCTIPLARGKSRSDQMENVLKNAKQIAESGVKEIVLTGVNTGDFSEIDESTQKRKNRFFDLIRALDEMENAPRYRISSIEPNLLTEEIIHFVAGSKRFMPHFHIPLQSGSDKVLRLMKRRYLTDLYFEKVSTILKIIPHACIGVDVIVGFPGETEEDFQQTFQFLHDLDIAYLHVFTYSERENTEAIKLPNVVPMVVRKERNQILRNLSEKKRNHFYQKNISLVKDILFENEHDESFMYGYTDNYIKSKAPLNPDFIQKIVSCTLDSIDAKGNVFVSINNKIEIK